MSTLPETMGTMRPRTLRPSWLAALLMILPAAGLVLGGAGIILEAADKASHVSLALILAGLMLLMFSGCLAMLALGQAVLQTLRSLSEQNASIQQQVSVMAERAVAQAQSAPQASAGLGALEMRALLSDLRETLLLPEAERQRRYERLVERELQRGLTAAERYIISRDFHRAREELAMLTERFGQDERLRTSYDRLEKAAEAARANDITHAHHRIDDLVSMGRWEEAERAARELLEKYPVSQEATALLIRVQRERKTYEQRHRQRLFDEIQQFVHQRKWQEAAAAARSFLQNFPSGPDSDALRPQLETLNANADIQARQALEQQLKDLIRQHQYWDALGLARRIISEHPLSPQANALRGQLPRLEELARQSPAPA